MVFDIKTEEIFDSLIDEIRKDEAYLRLKDYIQHGNISTYAHCLRVARRSFDIARFFRIKVNEKELLKGALLHDYFLYDWHYHGDKLHGYHHPHIAMENAKRDFGLTEREQNIIRSHMWPLTLTFVPKYREAALVCLADKICSVEETMKKDVSKLKKLRVDIT